MQLFNLMGCQQLPQWSGRVHVEEFFRGDEDQAAIGFELRECLLKEEEIKIEPSPGGGIAGAIAVPLCRR
jgi:hypothetical protein